MLTFLDYIKENSLKDFLDRKNSEEAHGREVAKSMGHETWHDFSDKPGDTLLGQKDLEGEAHFLKLPATTQQHVKDHTGYDSVGVNNHLFLKSQNKRSGEAKHHKERIKHLDIATTSHHISKPVSVYSGVNFNPGEHAQNGLLHLPGYTSTSLSKSVAAHHSRFDHKRAGEMQHKHIIRFELKPGQKGLYIGDHSFNREHELLLPRNTSIKLDPAPNVYVGSGGLSGKPHKFHVWKAHIVPSR